MSAGEFTALAALCALAAVLAATVKKHSPEQALLLSLGSCAVVTLALLPALNALKDSAQTLASLSDSAGFACLVKSVGIAIISQLASEACAESGQGALASTVSLAGRIAVIGLAAPVLSELMSLVSGMMDL